MWYCDSDDMLTYIFIFQIICHVLSSINGELRGQYLQSDRFLGTCSMKGGGHRGEVDGEGGGDRAREGCAKRSREDALTPPAKRSKSPLPSSSVTLSTFPSWHLVSQQVLLDLSRIFGSLVDLFHYLPTLHRVRATQAITAEPCVVVR